PRVYGRAGTYGQRCANFIVQNCDALLAVGTRLAIPQVGYDITEFARAAQVAVVDVDPRELAKYRERYAATLACDAGLFLDAFLARNARGVDAPAERVAQCHAYRRRSPCLAPDPAHQPAPPPPSPSIP